MPVTAYVNKRALSAGAYIALQADEIYMAPGGKMGAAAIIDGKGNAADKRLNHCGMQKWRTQRLKQPKSEIRPGGRSRHQCKGSGRPKGKTADTDS